MKLLPTFTVFLLGAISHRGAEPSVAVTAVNEFGIELHERFASSHPNLCLSPLSIETALAMTYAGADGSTRDEMAKVLRYPVDDKDGKTLNESFQKLNDSLVALCKASEARAAAEAARSGMKLDSVLILTANRIFGQRGYKFQAPFLATLKDLYHSPLEELDFASNPEIARRRVNGWVEEQTKKRIANLIPRNGITSKTRLALASALYFKAPWDFEFFSLATTPRPFFVMGKSVMQVETMTAKCTVRVSREDGFMAVGIPYAGADLQMVILLPSQPDGLAEVNKKLTAALLAKCAVMPEQEVILRLPKFKMASLSMPLGTELQAMGMKSAFDKPPGSANFAGMAPPRRGDYLGLSEIYHKTFIVVDERGAEAAAATTPGAMSLGGPPEPIVPLPPLEIRVDRPFIFAIQHAPSGACLFLGR